MLNNMSINTSKKYFNFNGANIGVLQYIDIHSRVDLINVTLDKCKQDGIYNEALMNAYLQVCAAYIFTDVLFTDEEKADSLNTYDILKSNGFIKAMLETIGEDQWESIKDELYQVKFARIQKDNSALNILNGIINNLPENAAAAEEIMKDFDMTQFKNVLDFAVAANNGRALVTNLPVE